MIPQPDTLKKPVVCSHPLSFEHNSTQQELVGALVCLVVTRVAFAVFESCYFQILAVAVTSFLLTSLAKKFIQQYTPLKEIERISVAILRKWPHLHIVAGVAASLFHSYVPFVSTFLAIGMGASAATVFRVKWLSAAMLVQTRR